MSAVIEDIQKPEINLSSRYSLFLEAMKRSHVHEGRKEIHETDTEFISTFQVKKGSSGKVMELHCPKKKAVSICGQSHADHQEPHLLVLRCFNESNSEPKVSTWVNIKTIIAGGENPLWKAPYGSLNEYHFKEGIFLGNGDRLIAEIIDPDIDIERVEVSMEADIFRPYHA